MALKEYHPEHGSAILRKLGCFSLVIVAVAVIWGGSYGLSLLDASRSGTSDKPLTKKEVTSKEEHQALLRRSLELIDEFEQIEYKRDVTLADAELLRESLALREQYFEGKDFVSVIELQRTRDLRKRLHDIDARPLANRAIALEAQAEAFIQEGKSEEALECIREATKLQRIINADYSLSDEASVSRLTRLARHLRELSAQPIYDKSVELAKAARAASEAGQWEQARENLEEALVLQREVIMNYSGLLVADMPRLRRLEQELISYESLESYLLVEEQVALAEQAEQVQDYQRAAEFYEKARALQAKLNSEYPGSRFAESARVAQFAERAQTVLSTSDAKPLLSELDSLGQALEARDSGRIGAIADRIWSRMESFRRQYPRSTAISEDDYQKVGWLSLVGNQIGAVYGEITNDSFLRLPENGDLLFRHVVSQQLFRTINGINPSRNKEPGNPVDSISFVEVERFCERVGWLLNAKVRPPTAVEWRSLSDSLETAKGLSGAIMSEWVRRDEQIGWVNPTQADQSFFERKVPTERNRMVTFRFVVEALR